MFVVVLACLSALTFISTVVYAAMSLEEENFLRMYFTDQELQVISATRSLKAISRVAENIEVVTKEDIELMNAHTLSEVLFFITGIESTNFVGPGAQGGAGIEGSSWTRVSVLLDGVPLQNENNGFAPGIFPVQMIEKIEIIKGPASSTWGSSFGGVINIISKSAGGGDNHINGLTYTSGGEHVTSDIRGELNGRKGPVGVYLFGGTMNSNGLINDHFFHHYNFFSKVTVDAPEKTKIDLSFLYHYDDSVQWDFLPFGIDDYHAYKQHYYYGKAAVQTSLGKDLDLNVWAWILDIGADIYDNTVSTGETLSDYDTQFNKYGFSGSLTWKTGVHTVVTGTDVLNATLKRNCFPGQVCEQRNYAFFSNDTISLGNLSITPGLRYDHSNLGGDILSPSLGATYLVSKDLLFKGLVTRGFHDPAMTSFFFNPNLTPEKIWSYQLGAEANVADIFNLKLTFFLHEVNDIILAVEQEPFFVNAGKDRTVGGELEVVTKKYRGFLLKAGMHYEDIKLKNFSDPTMFDNTKRYGFTTSLSYHGGKGLRAVLKGHYLWWNLPSFFEAKYNGFIMDFNIIKDIVKKNNTTFDVFFTAHNIFNSSSYDDLVTQNPDRWVEAGIRCKF
jgi:vitamin B12 transporter